MKALTDPEYSTGAVATDNYFANTSVFLERLRTWFNRNHNDEGPHRNEPSRRGFAITMCILIAVVLWFTLSLRKVYTDVVEMPTQVQNVPEGEALASQPPPTVQVQVRGEGIEIFRLRLDPPPVMLDARQGEVTISEGTLNLPKGLIFESVTPRQLNVATEPRIDRVIPIRPQVDIEPADTYGLVYGPALDPDSIRISGARSIVNQIDYWLTEPYQREGLRDSLSVQLALKDTLQALVNRSHLETTLTAVARQFTEGERELKVEVTGGASDRAVTLVPSTIKVRYRVPVEQYDAARSAVDFLANVSYDAIRADTTGRIRPELILPEGLNLTVISVEPPTLESYTLVEQ